MPLALDTNILIYAEGLNGPARQAEAKAAIADYLASELRLPAQVMAELFAVQVHKFNVAPSLARTKALEWASVYTVIDTTPAILAAAMQLCAAHRIAFWDAVVLASAAEAGCDTLLSEDFQTGFTWRGVTVVNPFASA